MVPSGKRLHNYGKLPILFGKLTSFQWPCSIAMYAYQMVSRSYFHDLQLLGFSFSLLWIYEWLKSWWVDCHEDVVGMQLDVNMYSEVE